MSASGASQGVRLVMSELGYRSVDPLPSADELSAFYAEVYYQALPTTTYQHSYSPAEQGHIDLKNKQVLHALGEAGVSASARLIEVGCGEGFLLSEAARAGYHVLGLDFSDFGLRRFNPHLADRLLVGDAYALLDDLAASERRFDACILNNVLEHVRDPVALLGRLHAILAPGGYLVVKVPNDFSAVQLRARELGHIARDFWVVPPQHLHYFTAESLSRLIEASGLGIVDLFADFPIDWFLMHPGSNYVADPARGKDAHKARVEIDLLLAESGLSRYHELCRALARCGAGRDVTVVARR